MSFELPRNIRSRSVSPPRRNGNQDRNNERYDRSYERGDRNNDRYDRNDRGDRNQRHNYGPVKKEFVNLRLTGLLAEDTNMYKGVKIIYNEPAEAMVPLEKWRLYTFKGEESLPTIHLHRQSGYLIGKQRGICEIPMDHPSISKQHAVIQFRAIDDLIKPYLIDLKSTNGTFINSVKIEAQKYYELREQDVLKFGFSTREYVLLTEKSAASDEEDF